MSVQRELDRRHRERYRKVLMREMTLAAALREATDDWQESMRELEGIVSLSAEEKMRARAEAIILPAEQQRMA